MYDMHVRLRTDFQTCDLNLYVYLRADSLMPDLHLYLSFGFLMCDLHHWERIGKRYMCAVRHA